jgi:tetratricopeptide (TPR) repeat protein
VSVRPEIVAVAALAVASHAAALRGGFVWLDHAHLEGGLALAEPARLGELFTRGFAGTGYYRPLTAVSLSLDAAVWGAPALFRAVTLGWHALAAVFVCMAGRALGLSARAGLIAGLAFAVHPLTTLVASATAFRSESMSLVGLLGLVIAHEARRPFWAALALLAGALTKETAWLLGPLFVVALELGRSRPAGQRRAPLSRSLLGAEAAAFALATLLRVVFAPPFRAAYPALSASEALGTRLAAIGKGALAVLVPIDRSICDAFPVTALTSPLALGGALVLAGVGYLAVRQRGAALLLGLSLLPALQLVPVMRWWSPHYLYIPLAFLALLLGRAAEHVLRDRVTERFRRAALGGLAAAGIACFALSLDDSGRYASDERLFRPELEREPACREAEFYLAEVARAAGRYGEAGAHYAHAAAPVAGYLAYVDEGAALQNLGAMRFAEGHLDGARTAFTHALSRPLDPDEARRLVHNIAVIALTRGEPAEAARLLEPETRRPDAMPQSLAVRARALHELHRDDEARVLLAKGARE